MKVVELAIPESIIERCRCSEEPTETRYSEREEEPRLSAVVKALPRKGVKGVRLWVRGQGEDQRSTVANRALGAPRSFPQGLKPRETCHSMSELKLRTQNKRRPTLTNRGLGHLASSQSPNHLAQET
jgi:hypothetical protein